MPFYTNEPLHTLHTWKISKQKEQLNKAIIEAGFCPSHFLMEKLTILRERKSGSLKEEFYLSHDAGNGKLLLTSTYSDSEKILTLRRDGCKTETFVFKEKLEAVSQK